MKKKIVSCLLVGVMCTLIGSVAYADESGSVYRADNIKSHGTLQYEQAGADNNVLIASQDLNYLADEIDELEDSYKRTATDSLAVIGQTPVSTVWSDICSAIEHSQDVSTGTTADNLSKDKGAWVNGEYITGNGADNKTNYNQGYTDGFNKAMNGASISYVYHKHKSNTGVTGTTVYSSINPGGCYRANGHTHDATGACQKSLVDIGPSEHCTFVMGCPDGLDAGVEGCWVCFECGSHTPGWSGSGSNTCYGSHTEEVYSCGEPTNTWTIGCGKTTSTIESATITFP